MIKANIILDKKIWIKEIKKPKIYFKKKLKKLSSCKNFKNKDQEFSVLLTDKKKMRDLNFKFRNKNKSTDVLSFPLKIKTKKNYLGDIAICFEMIKKKSKYTCFDHELDKIWIHGYLHLLGYDHKKNKDHRFMIKKEDFIFKKLNKIN